MHFSLNKIVPLLLPFFQMVSGSSIADMHTSLPSLRLVGSFSVGIEGLSAPFTFNHNIEFPLAPIGQRLLDWSDASTTTPAQPRISPSEIHDNGDTEVNSALLLGDAVAMIQQTDPDAGAIERSDEITASIEACFEDEDMQLVLRRQDSTESIVQSEDKHSTMKRKASELELELDDEWSYAAKRTKLELKLDEQPAQEKAPAVTEKGAKKHKKPKKRSKSDKRYKHCCHCEEQRI